jgi:hypothetical protein
MFLECLRATEAPESNNSDTLVVVAKKGSPANIITSVTPLTIALSPYNSK